MSDTMKDLLVGILFACVSVVTSGVIIASIFGWFYVVDKFAIDRTLRFVLAVGVPCFVVFAAFGFLTAREDRCSRRVR